MKACLRSLIRDLYFRAETDQLIERSLFRRSGVDARDHSHIAAAKQKFSELGANQAKAGEPHKRAQKVDPISALKFERNLRPDLEVVVPIDQQHRIS